MLTLGGRLMMKLALLEFFHLPLFHSIYTRGGPQHPFCRVCIAIISLFYSFLLLYLTILPPPRISRADKYEATRPGYSQEAVDFIVQKAKLFESSQKNPRVLDLAAGTGKLTRSVSPSALVLSSLPPSPVVPFLHA